MNADGRGLQNELGCGSIPADLESAPRVLLQNELGGSATRPQAASLPYKTSGGCGHDFFLGEHGLAQGLKFLQHVEVDLEVPRQFLLVGRDVSKELRVVAESKCLDHGGVDFRVRRLDVGVGFGVA